MTAISVDKLVALKLGLRYRQVVTLRKVWVLVVSFWLYHVSISPTLFFSADIFVKLINIEVLLCAIISTCVNSKIYFILRQCQAQVHVLDHVHQGQMNGEGSGINLARYKKTVTSALWGKKYIFFLSYMPWGLNTERTYKWKLSSSARQSEIGILCFN